MKPCWITDIHLNFLEDDKAREFLETVHDHDSDIVFLTGDIAESPVLSDYITMIDQVVGKPVYFVLGNHDFWHTSVSHIHAHFPRFLNEKSFTRWLTTSGVIALDNDTCVIGHEGWYDCRYGDWQSSSFLMREWSCQEDYRGCSTMKDVVERSQTLANLSIEHFKKWLPDAIKRFRKIIVLTHFPPYDDTHVYMGQIGSPQAQPFFTNRILGELLYVAASANPNKEFTVLAGHTHGQCSKQILPNMMVHVGGAEYGKPQIQPITRF